MQSHCISAKETIVFWLSFSNNIKIGYIVRSWCGVVIIMLFYAKVKNLLHKWAGWFFGINLTFPESFSVLAWFLSCGTLSKDFYDKYAPILFKPLWKYRLTFDLHGLPLLYWTLNYIVHCTLFCTLYCTIYCEIDCTHASK